MSHALFKELRDANSLISFGAISQIFGPKYDKLSLSRCTRFTYGSEAWVKLRNS